MSLNVKESINSWAKGTKTEQVADIAPSAESSTKTHDIYDDSYGVSPSSNEAKQEPVQEQPPLELDLEDDCEDGIDMEAIMAKVNSQLKRNVVKKPEPRQGGTIEISFTSRGNLPTAVARESEDGKNIRVSFFISNN